MVERVSGTTGAAGADEFAELLRALKDRSGLSYGALARRLHMSTSTLHRYCNGAAVPNEYAPVERLARLCRATPEELVELHRRWVMADAARRGRPGQATPAWAQNDAGDAVGGPAADAADAPDTGAPAADSAEPLSKASIPGPPPAPEPAPATPPAPAPDSVSAAHSVGAASPQARDEDGAPVVVDVPGRPVRSRRRRHAVIASAVAVTVLGAVVLAVNLPSSGSDGGDRKNAEAGATGNATGTGADREKDERPSKSASASPSESEKSGKPSVSASEPADGNGGGASEDAGGVPLNVAVRPYSYETPCSQYFLVDSEPEQVGPPATEQDASSWATAYGAVSSGEQRVALTVQGTGEDPVVLKALRVHVAAKNAPLTWKDYEMGSGCGGGVGTQSFDVDLDDGNPTTVVKNGQRDFPYEISESDPLVFYVNAHTEAHDVRWDLSLDWSSGDRSGTVHIDNSGTPFRTSGNSASPIYKYFQNEWVEREDRPGQG